MNPLNTPNTPIRIRRDSKPSPPVRDDNKKQNTMSSPPYSLQNPAPTIVALQQSDIDSIVLQLKATMHEDITATIRTCLKNEIENCVKEAMKPLLHEIDALKIENDKLKADVDALEQYSRRELIRFSGIKESVGENTTQIVKQIVASIDGDFTEDDIIRSHRVGNPNKKKSGPNVPRQIIVRLRDRDTKRRILKSSKGLKDSEQFSMVAINEDLTKTRNALAYRARQLKKKGVISQTWTSDGKIFLKDKHDRVSTVTTDFGLRKLISEQYPLAMNIAYPPPPEPEASQYTYAKAAATIPGN